MSKHRGLGYDGMDVALVAVRRAARVSQVG